MKGKEMTSVLQGLDTKTKVFDIPEFQYPGFFNRPAFCKIEAWKLSNNRLFVLFTDLSRGTSVTNAAESLLTTFYVQYLKGKYDKANCLFAETYNIYKEESIDAWIPEWTGDVVTGIDWKHIGNRIIDENPEW